MADIYTNELNVLVTEDAANNVNVLVTEQAANIVNVVEYGTPVILGSNSIFIDRTTHYSTEQQITAAGYGEHFNSAYKPIIIFENDIQKFELDGSAIITSNGGNDPFVVESQTADNLFKITADELPVFKMHTITKTPVSGGLLFINGDLFFGA